MDFDKLKIYDCEKTWTGGVNNWFKEKIITEKIL